MPANLLFDLAGIDTAAVRVSREALGAVIPQSGHMRQIDHIAWHDDPFTMGVAVRFVRHDEFWVPGHIPGRPLMPGVLMIEAAAQLSSFLQMSKRVDPGFLGFTRCDETVFRGQVVPGDTMILLAKEESSSRKRFVCRGQGLVGDRVVFETLVTGMVM